MRRLTSGYLSWDRRARPLATALTIAALGAACDKRDSIAPTQPTTPAPAPAAIEAGAPAASSAALALADATPAEGGAAGPDSAPKDGAAPAPSASAAPAPAPALADALDAGASRCRLLFGPAQQPYTGEATLVVTELGIDVVVNHLGAPIVFPTPTPPPAAKAARTTLADPPPRTSFPPCVVSAGSTYCADSVGAVHRTRGTSASALIGEARAGTRLAAAALGERSAVAFLAAKKTTEGIVNHAWLSVDDALPTVISEEGSGATYVTLRRRGPELVVLYLDARMAMTPVHARIVTWEGALKLGKDAVLFIAGTPERKTAAVIGIPASGDAFGLLPIAGEQDFGMAAIPIHAEPRDDVPAVWSVYPNGLDPALIAATEGISPVRVARVRPLEARPDSARVLELGQLDAGGNFTSLGFVPTGGAITTLAMVADKAGTLWLHYTNAAGSWLERRACDPLNSGPKAL